MRPGRAAETVRKQLVTERPRQVAPVRVCAPANRRRGAPLMKNQCRQAGSDGATSGPGATVPRAPLAPIAVRAKNRQRTRERSTAPD